MLRDYQLELYRGTVEAMKNGFRRPLVVAPCGAGKSYLFAEMIRRTRGEALVLTHRQELKAQHEALLEAEGIHNARVAMVLTEANRLGENNKPSLIITDEAHLSRSNSWMKVIEFYNTYTVGLTATPVRLDGKPLGDIYDALIQGVDTRWLIENKRLAPYVYYAPTLVETDGLRSVGGDYVLADLDQLMTRRAIYGDVVKTYQRLAPGERTIAYCVSVKHARETANAFGEAGIRAESVSSGTPERRRAEIMDDFRNGRIDVLCNVGIISEGVSIDEVSCCMLLRPTESVALGIQQMMRCMRYLPGKNAKIIDFVGNYTRVGLPDEDREWSLGERLVRRKQLNNAGDFFIRSCPQCFLTFQTAPVCPYCGAVYPLKPREIQAHKEIELARITAEEAQRIAEMKKKRRMEVGQARTYPELLQIAKERGYSRGWVHQMMRARNR